MKIAVLAVTIMSIGVISRGVDPAFAMGVPGFKIHSFVAQVVSLDTKFSETKFGGNVGDKIDRATDGFTAIDGGGRTFDYFNGSECGHVHFNQGIVVINSCWAERDPIFQVEKEAFHSQRLAYAHAVLFVAQVDHVNAVDFVDDLFKTGRFGLFQYFWTDLADRNRSIGSQLASASGRNDYLGKIKQRRL